MHSANWYLGEAGSDEFITPIAEQETPEFDITAMVDLVFMMNIYFLVTFITVALAEVNLPTAVHCSALDGDSAVIITVLRSVDGRSATVYLENGTKGEPVNGAGEQERRVAALVEQGLGAGRKDVLLKAEKNVRLGDIFRIATAAAVEGVKLHVSVLEKDLTR